MIKSFKCRETEKLWESGRSRRVPNTILGVALRKLLMIDSACEVGDLRCPPANNLEPLCGNRKGQWSIRINKQWRICFVWQGQDAFEVEIVDYH
ncbi:MAG: type II toxin-antitoxin system RelE/ParE family toxin [Pseudomonadota bacterium]